MLLCIMTFGDLGEVVTKEYWLNVSHNLTSISFMTIGLTLIQFSVKQGLAEQALQRGLNTENTTKKYDAHKELIASCNNIMIYLPYFLQVYNRRHTNLRKQEYLINNNYCSEAMLLKSNDKKVIKIYRRIIVNISAASIKWSTVEIIYDKNGRIITLDEHRKQRIKYSIFTSFISMIGVTFLAGGLFFAPSDEPLWQKFIKLFTYIMAIAIGAVFTVVKEYEKGAFGVPNELDEINQIWHEFKNWKVPEWVKDEISKLNENMEVYDEQGKTSSDIRANIQEKQTQGESVRDTESNNLVSVSTPHDSVLLADDKEFGR